MKSTITLRALELFSCRARMFQVGEDCEVMIRVDEESEEEDFELVSGETCKAREKNTQ